jgi:hypothetical protein
MHAMARCRTLKGPMSAMSAMPEPTKAQPQGDARQWACDGPRGGHIQAKSAPAGDSSGTPNHTPFRAELGAGRGRHMRSGLLRVLLLGFSAAWRGVDDDVLHVLGPMSASVRKTKQDNRASTESQLEAIMMMDSGNSGEMSGRPGKIHTVNTTSAGTGSEASNRRSPAQSGLANGTHHHSSGETVGRQEHCSSAAGPVRLLGPDTSGDAESPSFVGVLGEALSNPLSGTQAVLRPAPVPPLIKKGR